MSLDTDQRIDAIEAGIRALEDVGAIEDLHRRYVRQLANREWDAMHDVFAEDAIVDLHQFGPRAGRDACMELFHMIERLSTTPDGYVLTSPMIDVDGSTARGEWTWHRFQCEFPIMTLPTRVYGPWWEARYWCDYRRCADGAWRISALKFRIVLPDPEQP